MKIFDGPHHDGSELYVPQGTPQIGDVVPVRLRVPAHYDERAVWLRPTYDAEPMRVQATLDSETEHERWYTAELTVQNPVTHYRWLLDTPGKYRWVNGRGVSTRDVPNLYDFRVTTFDPPPAWARDAFVYQIFPDRFARSDAFGSYDLPDWAERRDWDDEPFAFGRRSGWQYFGGDLYGIEQHLDYLQKLGVTALYLTPFFPARSVHRYDGTRFDAVDPLLGGDAALASLANAIHHRGMRIIGDLTTNHTGIGHVWFQRAQADVAAPERDFYYWQEHQGHPYVSWLGIHTLPKLNWGSPELWSRLIDGPDSVIRQWLRPPYNLDGWRIDVANMSGRFQGDDYNQELARRIHGAIVGDNPSALLVSEHFHDAAADVRGDGWMSNMNYSAFTRPLWTWVVSPVTELDFLGTPARIPRLGGKAMVKVMREMSAGYSWPVRTGLWNMLSSHDTPRIRTVTGSAALVEVAAAMLFTSPGTPVVFMGDEGGFTGINGEAGRRTMPWDQIDDSVILRKESRSADAAPPTPVILHNEQRKANAGSPALESRRWDPETFEVFQRLAAVRASSRALREGGLRWVFAGHDAVAFLRETFDERILVVLARAPWPGIELPTHIIGPEPPELRYGDAQTLAGKGPAVAIFRLSY